MREILFKAKTTKKDNPKHEFSEKWVEGNLILCGEKAYIHPTSNKIRTTGEIARIIVLHEVIPNTICQYTGLTDKNGQKIWENDILCGRLDDIYPENITYKKVVWDMNGFYTKEKYPTNFEILHKFDTEYFEVCGNIFDNVDLLEVEE